MSRFLDNTLKSTAWPFTEAHKILARINNRLPTKGYVLFETGYGPSGLPHIGTFSEVARTAMVINAFQQISDIPTKLICFSDDMDALRKVPSNIPNQQMLKEHLGKPLTAVPDPFGQTTSFGDYMNDKLRQFLDMFNFKYEFFSATECYRSGMFDNMLLKALSCYEQIMEVMLPTLRNERQATYSPFLPICPDTGRVLQIPAHKIDKDAGTITFKNEENGQLLTTSVTGGRCKLQWKPDFAMRWATLEVDYEIYGKDHLSNQGVYSSICQILGQTPPVQFFYELFLDESGAKISKSKGNSITIESWLDYAPMESILLFIYQSPGKAKRLHLDIIPKSVDSYLSFIKQYHDTEDQVSRISNPVYHIHNGNVPQINVHNLSFNLLLNLASACNPENQDVLWGFIKKYAPDASPSNASYLNKLVQHAVKYYNDYIKPMKNYLLPSQQQKVILEQIITMLKESYADSDEEIQSKIYKIGVDNGHANLRIYFQELYQILFGQLAGPRLGSFIRLFGIDNTINLIQEKINQA